MALHLKSTGIDYADFGHAPNMGSLYSELLDDYEEGSWTPYLRGSTGTAGNHAHNMTGQYTKIGGLCQATGYGYITNLGSWSGIYNCYSFPFTCSRQSCPGSMGMYPSSQTDQNWRTIQISNNQAHAWFPSGNWMDTPAPWSEVLTGRYHTLGINYYAD